MGTLQQRETWQQLAAGSNFEGLRCFAYGFMSCAVVSSSAVLS